VKDKGDARDEKKASQCNSLNDADEIINTGIAEDPVIESEEKK